MPQTEPQTYTVTFDPMASVGPLTVSADQMDEQIHRAFLAAEVVDIDDAFSVAIDVPAGTVVVRADGDVIEHGTITGPAAPTLQQRFAAELHRIADDIARLNLPVADTMCGSLGLGVLDSRADLERWAAYLGSEIAEDGGTAGDIPRMEHRILLDGRPYGAWLTVHAQIQPDGRSEVERLRAEVAQLRAQVSGGAA